MSVRATLYGDYLDLADEILEEMVPRAKAAVQEGTAILEAEVKRLVTMRTSGPAIEGQPPVQRSGELAESFRTLPVRVKGMMVSSGVRTTHPGAARLEYGKVDRAGRRTYAHPYMEPAVEAAQPKVEARMRELL